MLVVNSLNDLTKQERMVYLVLSKTGFHYVKDVAHRANLSEDDTKVALRGLYAQGFILTDKGKVAVNVLAKRVLGFHNE